MAYEDKLDTRVLELAVARDPAALDRLLTDTYLWLCDYVARRMPPDLRSIVDAEDIIQQTHLEVFHRIGDFAPNGVDSFRRWVRAIALSRLRNSIKGHRATKRGGRRARVQDRRRIDDSTVALLDHLAGPGATPSRCVARGEAIDAVKTALDALPEHYRQAVRLVHIEGHRVCEAAALMGRTERAIHGLCRQGLKRMRDYLQKQLGLLGSAE